jgi:hypothetical protein
MEIKADGAARNLSRKWGTVKSHHLSRARSVSPHAASTAFLGPHFAQDVYA